MDARISGSDPTPVDPAQVAAVQRDPLRLREALVEIDRRALGGIYIYTPCWLALCAHAGLVTAAPLFAFGVAFGFALLGVARYALHRRFSSLVERRPLFARRLFFGLLLCNTSAVGLLAVLALYWPPMQPAREGIVLIGGVSCCAATLAMSLDPLPRWGVPLTMMGPYLVTVLVDGALGRYPDAVFIGFFAIYLQYAATNGHRDYWNAIAAASLLTQRARELERQSMTDPLTHIANRRYFEQQLAVEWSRAARLGGPLAVLLVDLDRFKRINDRYGHPAGDRCLIETAAAMQRAAGRDMDTVARYGGEEFVVLLPGTGTADARTVAERIRVEVAALRVDVAGDAIPLTCSIGYATAVPATGTTTTTDLLARADAALYQAKDQGRNRVVSADRVADEPPAPMRNTGWRHSTVWSSTLPG